MGASKERLLNSMADRPSAPSCGERFCECFAGNALFLFNGVDALCGAVLLTYGGYLGLNGYAPQWLYVPIVALGGFLFLTTLLSCAGTSWSACECCLSMSSFMLIVASTWELVFAFVIFFRSDDIAAWLRAHQEELHITDKELAALLRHRLVPAYLLAGLFLMELMRCFMSSALKATRESVRERQRHEYTRLKTMAEVEMSEAEDAATREQEISTKYTAMKEKYDHKYRTDPDV